MKNVLKFIFSLHFLQAIDDGIDDFDEIEDEVKVKKTRKRRKKEEEEEEPAKKRRNGTEKNPQEKTPPANSGADARMKKQMHKLMTIVVEYTEPQ